MRLLNNLYHIISTEQADGSCVFHIRLNPECFIYKAHFPGQPITPGVCVSEIAVELAEEALECPLTMTGVKNVKFLSIMTPEKQQDVDYILTIKEEDGMVRVQAVARSSEEVYAKISLICRK